MLNDQDYELLSAYIDGALTESERTALEARLLAETELRDELEALRGTVALIRALPLREAPRNFTLTHGMVQARRPAARRFMLTSTAISFVSAAAAVFLIGFSLLLLSGNRANAPQTSSNVALAMTNTGFGESDTTLKTDEQPAAVPAIVDQVTTTEIARQNTTEALNQPPGVGAAADSIASEAQETAPLETQSDGETANLQQQEVSTEESAMLFAAPAAASMLPEPTASDFYYAGGDGAQTSGTIALTLPATQVAQPLVSESGQPGQPSPQDSSSALAQRADNTPTQPQLPSPTVTVSTTPTATSTITATPTLTLTATATAAPTLTATPTPAVTSGTGTIDTPVVMLVAGILLLALSGIFYARSRRQV